MMGMSEGEETKWVWGFLKMMSENYSNLLEILIYRSKNFSESL